MDIDIREIRDYYDSEIRDYDYNELVRLGVSHDNAEFMVSIGVPEEYNDFMFYGSDTFQKTLIEGVQYIKIGHFTSFGMRNSYGLYFKESSSEFFTTSSLHEPHLYMINKDLGTFFLFHLIKNELVMKMKQENEYSTQKYAHELQKMFDQIDPVAMKDVEGFWSHFIEDYETDL
ncbi:SUKH-4 family immunity protein [Lysinibacillus xylanilyticus]|uniref:SUKH-4 family immunity protein n=1 Tax=Lysinibacillus xylanilyticus TaxID=582475 RepID=UPI00382E37A7